MTTSIKTDVSKEEEEAYDLQSDHNMTATTEKAKEGRTKQEIVFDYAATDNENNNNNDDDGDNDDDIDDNNNKDDNSDDLNDDDDDNRKIKGEELHDLEIEVEDLEIGTVEIQSSKSIYQQKTSSTSEVATLVEDDDKTLTPTRKQNMPYIEEEDIPLEEFERATRSREYEHSIEDPIDLDMFRDNVITIQLVDIKNIPANNLSPREQEKADEPVREGMRFMFDNKFMKAKNIFQSNASHDPLYALGLGAMAFIKAIMTYDGSDIEVAIHSLDIAYTIAKAQVEKSTPQKRFKDLVNHYISSLFSNRLLPNLNTVKEGDFIPNGVLRAHVIKAECCLLSSILQITQESTTGYLKCGLNLRKAYSNYNVVWQEYKKMGQEFSKYMDCDTVSAVQFGIGAIHLILSSLPPDLLSIFSTLGWKSDKQLGFALLKLCLEGRGIRSPLASLTLLSYYSILTSFAPQLYSKEMMSPTLECLLDAQKNHPNSCFFLFFAARIARVARNISLSIQSFTFAVESSRGEWAEVSMKQMSDYEIGFNLALQLDWEGAANYFEQLCRERYWSPAFSKYFVASCREMMGQRTEAILAFAQVGDLVNQDIYIDAFCSKKVDFFQRGSGYQDLDFSLPMLEILLVLNAFEYMERACLEKCLEMVQSTLERIYERERVEYNIRIHELVPSSTPPDYYDQRVVLLLIKSSILNSLNCYGETVAHLNWIMDHKDDIKTETWVLPFTYWESGVTSWGLGNYNKSRMLWQLALRCTRYDFEYRMAVRLSIALGRCDELGVTSTSDKDIKGPTTNGRKRMPIISSF